MGLVKRQPTTRLLGGTQSASETLGPVLRSTFIVTAAMSPYTVQSGDYALFCDCTAGAITVNLPTAVGNTREIRIKKVDASANAVTIDPFGAQTIDGAATNTDLDVQYEAYTIQADGSNYLIVGGY